MNKENQGKHGVQSFEIGMQILQAILNGHRGMMLKEIAAAAGMPASKVHRYLVSMVRSGLMEKNNNNSRYDLGPLAMNIGLAAVDRLDRIQKGFNAIAELCTDIRETTALAIWSPNGPVVIRWEKPNRALTVSVATGTALNMITTASGRAFGAYLAPEAYEHLIEKELAEPELPKEFRSRPAVVELFSRTRQLGLAIVENHHLASGVAAIGAPVFNAEHEISFVMSIVGFQDTLDTSLNGPVVATLKSSALKLSKSLGYQGEYQGE
ncbi:MAG: IclR family transcriptional regulator [Desulfobacula sp.]